MKLLMGLLILTLAACSTSHKEKSEVQDLDTKLDNSQDVNGETLGVRDDSLVVQKKRLLAEELRELQNYTYGLQDEVYGSRNLGSRGLYGVYRDCQADMAANGETPFIEEAEKVIVEKDDMKFGKDEDNKLVTISEEFISERIERFKAYREKLEKRRAEYELKVRVCSNKRKAAKKAE